MKIVQTSVFVADDGTQFLSEVECKNHEDALRSERPWLVVAGRTVEELERAAKTGQPPELADALERIGRVTGDHRRERGDIRRPRRKEDDEAPGPVEAEAPVQQAAE